MKTVTIRYMPLWADYLDLLLDEELSDEEIGQLLRIMLRFYFWGQEPESIPKSLKSCWVLVKTNLQKAQEHYLTCVNNGKKGGRPKAILAKPKLTQQNPKKPIQEQEQEQKQEQEQNNNKNTDTRSAPSRPGEREGGDREKHSFGEFGWVKLTTSQYERLSQQMGTELEECIRYVDELAQSTQNARRWKDWYLMLRRCYRDSWHREAVYRHKAVPTGASGNLGSAELEAIARVLREE